MVAGGTGNGIKRLDQRHAGGDELFQVEAEVDQVLALDRAGADQRACAACGEEFEQHRVRHPPVEDVGPLHAAGERLR